MGPGIVWLLPHLLVVHRDDGGSGRNPSHTNGLVSGEGAVVREKADLTGENSLRPQ